MSSNFRLTYHAEQRIWQRLSTLVTASEVLNAVNNKSLPKGRSYVEIKRVQFTEIADPAVKPDGIARGDQLVAVVDNDYRPCITTVILRKSWSKSPIYSNIIQ